MGVQGREKFLFVGELRSGEGVWTKALSFTYSSKPKCPSHLYLTLF